jgi:poly-gamma-glutamate synthesis protein (capsule biosynthesis protein)
MANSEEGTRLRLALTGDALITRPLSVYSEKPFLEMIELLRGADVAFTNLEMLLRDWTQGAPNAESGGTYMTAHPRIADELAWAGFRLFAAANNHSFDYGHAGLLATIEHLERRGLAYAGAGRNLAEARAPGYLQVAQGRVALVAMCSTFAPGALAGEQRPDMPGRPGLNPLRCKTRYVVTHEQMAQLRRISQETGLEAIKAQAAKAWAKVEQQDTDTLFHFLGQPFELGDRPAIRTDPHPGDLEGNLRSIRDAARQAHWVIASLHHHEKNLTREQPAEFVPIAARRCLEAGAHAFVGHGPHLCQGIEIYQGRPIFYSLGNFVFQNEMIERLPTEIYERYGLDHRATPADLYDARSYLPDGSLGGRMLDPPYWESVIALCRFAGSRLAALELVPVTLGMGTARPQRGRPVLAEGAQAKSIIEQMGALSAPYGTEIEYRDGRGVVRPS